MAIKAVGNEVHMFVSNEDERNWYAGTSRGFQKASSICDALGIVVKQGYK
jgi:hypothetical protein